MYVYSGSLTPKRHFWSNEGEPPKDFLSAQNSNLD